MAEINAMTERQIELHLYFAAKRDVEKAELTGVLVASSLAAMFRA